MATKGEQGPLNLRYGHTETHVLLKLSRSADTLLFSPEEADALIRNIQLSKEQLAEYQSKAAAAKN